MRIMKINDNTVRIIITFTELDDMNLSLTDFFQRSARSEQFFWDLIAKAKEEVDFHIDQPFWIQAMVASDEEFVVTVVKQEDTSDSDFGQLLQQTINERRAAMRQASKNAARSEWVYAFEDLEDVIAAAAVLPDLAEAHTALYQYEEEYYLAVSKIALPRKRKNTEAILDEYGENIVFAESFLQEHAEIVIAEQAISSLRSLQS